MWVAGYNLTPALKLLNVDEGLNKMLSSGRESDRNRPEQQKYLKWLTEEKKKGLVDIKLTINPFKPVGLSEEIFKELNLINEKLALGEVETIYELNKN